MPVTVIVFKATKSIVRIRTITRKRTLCSETVTVTVLGAKRVLPELGTGITDPSAADDFSSTTHALQKRHLCVECPPDAGISPYSHGSLAPKWPGENGNEPARACCPRRETRTITSGTSTSTKWKVMRRTKTLRREVCTTVVTKTGVGPLSRTVRKQLTTTAAVKKVTALRTRTGPRITVQKVRTTEAVKKVTVKRSLVSKAI